MLYKKYGLEKKAPCYNGPLLPGKNTLQVDEGLDWRSTFMYTILSVLAAGGYKSLYGSTFLVVRLFGFRIVRFIIIIFIK